MTLTVNGVTKTTHQFPATSATKKSKSGHTQPKPYKGYLEFPGRVRVANWLHLLNISHSAFYARLKHYHKYRRIHTADFSKRDSSKPR